MWWLLCVTTARGGGPRELRTTCIPKMPSTSSFCFTEIAPKFGTNSENHLIFSRSFCFWSENSILPYLSPASPAVAVHAYVARSMFCYSTSRKSRACRSRSRCLLYSWMRTFRVHALDMFYLDIKSTNPKKTPASGKRYILNCKRSSETARRTSSAASTHHREKKMEVAGNVLYSEYLHNLYIHRSSKRSSARDHKEFICTKDISRPDTVYTRDLDI